MISAVDSESSSLAPIISSSSVVTKRIKLIDHYFEELEEFQSE
jgi:hypothetical protein